MPAPFAASLCGYRVSGTPNTSDAHDKQSVELGNALFAEMNVDPRQVGGDDPGAGLEMGIVSHLQPLRADLDLRRSRSALEFEQYAHLSVLPKFQKTFQSATPRMERIIELALKLPDGPIATALRREVESGLDDLRVQDSLVEQLRFTMPEESLLKVDITAGAKKLRDPLQTMLLGLSSKWTLRTDRAQDCISQGSKLASQRRGAMPHFAVITMETRPAMLRLIANSSGAIDCVYHLDLPALGRAVDALNKAKGGNWGPADTFSKLVQQRRLRDYDELVETMAELPSVGEAGY